MDNKEFFEDDRPRDLSKYENWTLEQIKDEISQLEDEIKRRKAQESNSENKNEMAV